jgi:hypothetical protein
MAGNMDPNDIQGVAEAMEELRKNGTLSAESLAKLGGNSVSAGKALEGYTRSILGAGAAVGGMAKAVAQGEGSFNSLGASITGLTSVVGKLAGAIPLVGGAAKALAEGVGEAAKFVLDQLDTMARNYQTLGDASAGAADGVDGLLRQFNQMGNYSLPAFSKAVRANTLGLAAFQGTAAQGAEELSKVSGALTTGNTAQRFLKLGMSLDAVGDATTEYLSTSARYGILQGNTTEELTKKTQNYIEEVDKIARLTGQTREAQQKEAQKSLVDARFRAKIADMQASGQGAQAEELRKYVEGLGGAAGDAARALVTGIPLTKEAAKANLFANDAIRQNTMAIQEGRSATVAIANTQQALADGSERFGKQIMYAGDQFGGIAVQAFDTAAILKEQNKLMATGMTREQAIEAIQKKQMTASGKNTEQFTKAQLAVANSSKNLQSLGFSLAEAAIPAVELFATTLDKATSFMNKKFGLGGTVPARPTEGAPATSATVGSTGGSKSVTIGDQTRIGGDRNWRNNNPGNIEYGPFAMQYGAVGSDGRFAIFPSEELGRKAQDALLKSKNYANLSLENAIKRYAPSNENDPKSYANQIMKATGIDTSKTYASLSSEEQGKVLDAMKKIEGGRAGTIAGPTSGYRSQVAGGNPSSAGSETTAQGNQAAGQQQTAAVDNRMIQRLDELVALQRQNNNINAKLLQNSRG